VSYSHRKDDRTDEEFANDLKQYHELEEKWANTFLEQLRAEGHKVELERCGVDPSGEVLKNLPLGCNIDRRYNFEDGKSYLLEIKTAPDECETKWDFFTFKASSLKHCLKYDAFILVPMSSRYYLFSPKALNIILNSGNIRVYKGFSPNDKAVRLGISKVNERYNTVCVMELVDSGLINMNSWTI
jgi:hypothetical protein